MSRFKHFGVLLVAVAAVALSATDARATIMAQVTVNAGPVQTVNNNGTITSGSVTISFNLTSNSPGSPGNAQISTNTISANNVGGTTTTLALTINASDLGFTTPTGNGTLSSTLSGNYGPGVTVTSGTFQSWANLSNTQFATSGISGGPQLWSAPPIATGTVNITGAGTLNIAANGVTSPFALTNLFSFSVTLAPGAQLSLSGTTNLFAQAPPVIPEPATITGGLVGLVSLGLYRLRRRKAVVA
jgi:hypothetical protein